MGRSQFDFDCRDKLHGARFDGRRRYHFRIVAVTDVGSSPPRQVSPTVKVEEQANRPHIDLGSVQDITVRAGEDFSIVVPYKAFPKPTAAWFANGVVLDETADTPRCATIVVRNPHRKT